MTRAPIRRLVSLVSVAVLAAMAFAVGPVSAAPPNWTLTAVRLPDTVSYGADAGFRITIRNGGPSNISSLFLVSDQTAQPSYISVPTQGACNATGALFCSFGALTNGNSVVVTVAYSTPPSGSPSFPVQFQGNTSGNTFSDIKGRSHGDTLVSDPKVTTTALSDDGNFDGGFVVEASDTSFATNADLGRRNIQATSLESPNSRFGVTIQDGLPDNAAQCVAPTGLTCPTVFGEWSKLSVDEGHVLGTPFKVTLLVLGSKVPGGTTTDEVVVVHVIDNGTVTTADDTTEVIGDQDSETCDSTTGTPTIVPCITVTKVGTNFKIVVWLLQNGFARGGI